MISEECKKRSYPSLEHFKSLYYDRIFKIKRMYSLENWYSNVSFSTYYIKYTEDVLASGNVHSSDNIGDYITVVKTQDKNYININSYIGCENNGNITEANGIEVIVDKINMYMDYTYVTLKVKNNTGKTICIDSKQKLDTMYLQDTNGVTYTAFLNENAVEEFRVSRNMEITVEIKFNKMYNPSSREINKLVLGDIVLNYDEFSRENVA